jgi:hypothetical protein
MLRCVAFVRTGVSEERIASINSVTRIGGLETRLVVKNSVFWDVTPCGSCKNRRFGGTYRLHQQCDKNRWTRNNVNYEEWRLLRCYAVWLL